MALHTIVLWTVVVAVGIPSAVGIRWRPWPFYLLNPTAAALVVAKLAGWAWVKITGDNLPVDFYLFPDMMVVAVIMAKDEYCNQLPYRGAWHQLKCVLLERSPADRFVLLSFVACWALYVAPIHDYYRWWLLYGLTALQFIFAGAESLENFWRWRVSGVSLGSIINRHMVVIPFPLHRRNADAVRKTPEFSDALLTVSGGGGSG